VRFVGGPWHNRLVDIPLDCKIFEARHLVSREWPQPCTMESAIYRRTTCYTEEGTRYVQFVHDSMFDDGMPRPEVYGEHFAAVAAAGAN
jgi:hypothetical protein